MLSRCIRGLSSDAGGLDNGVLHLPQWNITRVESLMPLSSGPVGRFAFVLVIIGSVSV